MVTSVVDILRNRRGSRHSQDERLAEQAPAIELARLKEENAKLRSANADLKASAEIWIRLYEAALIRST